MPVELTETSTQPDGTLRSEGSVYGPELEVNTLAPDNIDTDSVRLRGELSQFFPAFFTDNQAKVLFYWVEQGQGSVDTNTESAGFLSQEDTFTFDLTGLSPDTTYEVRAIARIDGQEFLDSDGGPADDGILEITTDALLAVTTDSATNLTFAEATLNGSLDDLGGAEEADVFFEYGPQSGNVDDFSTPATTTTSTGSFAENIDSLDPATTYDFRISADASDGDSIDGSPPLSFTTPDFALGTSTTNVLGVDSIEVTGVITTNPSGTTVDAQIEYREQGATDWNSVVADTLSSGTFTETIDGLVDNTTYEFRARVDYAGTSIIESPAVTATTDTAVVVSANAATAVGIGTATFNGSLDTLDGSQTDATVAFEYGPTSGNTTEFTEIVETRTSTGTFDADITGLDEDTEYRYIATAESSPSGDTDESAPVTFTTGELAISTDTSPTVEGTDAEVEGEVTTYSGTTENYDVFFEYREVGASMWNSTPSTQRTSGDGTGTFSDTISGLDPDTDYEFRAVGDMNGERREGIIVNFTTEALEIESSAATDVNVGSATLNGSLDMFASTETDVDVDFSWGPQGNVSQNTVNASPTSLGAPGSFSLDLTGLDKDTPYEFRAEGTSNPSNDFDTGQTLSFTTDDVEVTTTATPTSTTSSSLTIEGEVTVFTGDGDIEVGVQYVDSATGNIDQNGTEVVSDQSPLTNTGTFTTQITGLGSSTSYDFRAFARVDGVTVTGTEASAATT